MAAHRHPRREPAALTSDVLLIQDSLDLARTRPGGPTVAGDGEQAVAFLRRTDPHADAPRPDVVLLDSNMPRMNGRQVLAELKADPHLRTIPIIVFTTAQGPDDIRQLRDARERLRHQADQPR